MALANPGPEASSDECGLGDGLGAGQAQLKLDRIPYPMSRTEKFLMALGIVGSLVLGWLIVSSPWMYGSVATVSTAPHLAQVSIQYPIVRHRLAGTLVWRPMEDQMLLRAGDAIFVDKDGDARIQFLDGLELTLHPSSMMVVAAPEDSSSSRVLELRRGSLSLATQTEDAIVEVAGGIIQMQKGSKARIQTTLDRESRVEVSKGSLNIESGGTRAELSRNSAAFFSAPKTGEEGGGQPIIQEYSIDIQGPHLVLKKENSRGRIGVSLRWKPDRKGITALVSRTTSFKNILLRQKVEGSTADLYLPPGIFFIRLIDSKSEQTLSRNHRVRVRALVPPTPLFPFQGEVVVAPPGTIPLLVWTPVPEATTYRVQISTDATFSDSIVKYATESTDAIIGADLVEDSYYWRVSAEIPGSSVTWSRTQHFRLAREAVVDAPTGLEVFIE